MSLEAQQTNPIRAKLLPMGILLSFFIFSLILSLSKSGTYDSGDSLMHFQFAHWAWEHPSNLLDHWAKPFFTLVAAPFAAFGFAGMKFLQCLLVFGTGFFVYKIAQKFAFSQPSFSSSLTLPLTLESTLTPSFALLLFLAAPALILSQLSGLTEPMFGFFLSLGIWLMLNEKLAVAAIALSVLPFIRTEGFMLMPAFGLYLLFFRKAWLPCILLATTTAIYAIVGGFVFGDLLWIWTKNPYAGARGNYGIGTWTDFLEKYIYVVGLPIYGLTILGLLAIPIQVFRKKLRFPAEFLLLILLPFLIYFGAHVVFWATGFGHSMGMIRVLIAVLPLGALIAFLGLQMLLDLIPEKLKSVRIALSWLVLAYVCLFPILPNPASLKAKDFELTTDQLAMQQAADWLKAKQLNDRITFSAYPAAAFYMNRDPFDQNQFRKIDQIDKGEVPIGSIIVWDNWFGALEGGITPRFLEDNAFRFKALQAFKSDDGKRSHEIAIFEKI